MAKNKQSFGGMTSGLFSNEEKPVQSGAAPAAPTAAKGRIGRKKEEAKVQVTLYVREDQIDKLEDQTGRASTKKDKDKSAISRFALDIVFDMSTEDYKSLAAEAESRGVSPGVIVSEALNNR